MSDEEVDYDGEIRVMNDLKNQIIKGHSNFKKSPKDRISEAYITTRLEGLEDTLRKFRSKHESVLSTFDTDTLKKQGYLQGDLFQDGYECYLDYKTDLKNALSKFNIKHNPGGDGGAPNDGHSVNGRDMVIRLPKITLPTFSGEYSEWSSFRDLFLSLVHNNPKLDDVQRLHYLKTQLSSEAEQLIRFIPVTKANYIKCWDILQNRYNNKRLMSNCILKRLFSQKNVNCESSTALKELLDTTTDCLHELTNLGIKTEDWDIIVIYVICLKLDGESRKQWELQVSTPGDDLPSFKQFKEFLEVRFRALEMIEPRSKPKQTTKNASNPKVLHATTDTEAKQNVCKLCSEDHKLHKCEKLIKEDVDKRRELATSLRVCFNCLGDNHTSYKCRSSTKCLICHRRHHTLLHPKGSESAQAGTSAGSTKSERLSSESPSTAKETVLNISSHFLTGNVESQTLLATALIKAESRDGKQRILRALIDQGSQASFISESAVQYLQLTKIPAKSTISGLGGGKSGLSSKCVVRVNIQSLYTPDFQIEIQAHVIGRVTSRLPERGFSVNEWSELHQLALADPRYNQPNKVDVLLGAEVYCKIIKEGLIRNPTNTAIAQDTYLGWIVSGTVGGSCDETRHENVVLNVMVHTEELDILKRFWELESEPVLPKLKLLTAEEQACEDHFQATTRRDETGRYIVELPFRRIDSPCKYGDSRNIAVKRLLSLEKRLNRDIKSKEQYSEVLQEYLTLGHMERISEESEKEKPYKAWLPHHAVIRTDKSTTKTRVVFNASSKGSDGVSLNDTLMIGPTLQPDLRHLVLRWRLNPICLTADIVKMYRQVRVADKHTDFQRIVWRTDLNSQIEDYRLLTVTFGTASAPYLAVKALQQTAVDEGHSYPLAAERVKSDFYMDDFMSGCQSETEAREVYLQMNEMLKKGGFILQKWASNKIGLLEDLQANTGKDFEIKVDEVTKVLGLTWNRCTDDFNYSVKLSPVEPETKRQIISEISRLYDPLGWIAPCIITAKVFIQKLWISGLDWDDVVPPNLLEEWKCYRNQLSHLVKFQIPRWLNCSNDDVLVELHGFSDASNLAYAAVVYARIIDAGGNIHTQLVTAKTKVAPIKQVSVPRLELCGAVLVTKLLIEVAEVLAIDHKNLRAWTDSTVVLAWLCSHPRRWKTFVANRTAEILDKMDAKQWAYVKSQENPADCASRGIPASALEENQLWLLGPEWLRHEPILYTKPSAICTKTDLEEKAIKAHTTTIDARDSEWWTRFSSLRRLVRVVTYCRRFLQLKIQPKREFEPYLSPSETETALMCGVRQCQTEFSKEIHLLTNNQCLPKRSRLITLSPFVDKDGILRVGGRVKNSALPEKSKHPILIPENCHLAKLIVADAHDRTIHGGQQLMLNFIRSKFWILRVKNLIKAHVRDCVPCIRQSATVRTQLMGQLPACRVTVNKPFLNAGVDYAGPIQMRISKGRGQRSYKGYICLFVCMATRAVHIEAVSDLTSQGFLAAFKRFVARRGRCSTLWSDNGTNFIGASRELNKLFTIENTSIKSEVVSSLTNNGTSWHFIPPHAPHFGGIWEAGIKSTKYHLKRIIGDSTLTYEEMVTVLYQIEACLNSRPLTEASSDPNDPEPLTPGHFLVGEPLITAPDINWEFDKVGSLRRWQLTQRIVQSFWRRWSQEYLTHFFQRYKWNSRNPQPSVGDVVLVREDNLPPAKWLYGLVEEIHPGKDGITRVVSLRCKGSLIKRPTTKLCVLPK